MKAPVRVSSSHRPLAGVFAWREELSPTRRGEDVCVSGSRLVSWPTPQSETGTARANELLVVRGGNLSCEAETWRARRRLIVRGGNYSEGVPLVGNWLEVLPTGQEQEVLPVMVLTGVLSPLHLESWPSHCQS
jgi:hypothetical protein